MTPFSTPALVVDLDTFEANVSAMQSMLAGSATSVRPHVKTHRTPELAKRQLGGSARGVTCATVGEAEVMVAAGIDDVLIANEVVDGAKLARIASLATGATVTIAADDADAVRALGVLAAQRGVTVGVLIDVDILLHRCGVASIPEAIALAAVIEQTAGLRLTGIMGYEGRVRLNTENRAGRIEGAYQMLRETRDALVNAGHEVGVVSAGGTSTLREAIAEPAITEIQAGVYCLMEPELLVMDLPFKCAAAVRGMVISRHPGWVVADAGRRVIGMEYGPPIPVGIKATNLAISDEHATITMEETPPPLGALIDFIPGQIRTTFNLHDQVWISRAGEIIDCWPVAARGSSQ
jgi:D-serine deaminase-like pyridoxal phosphate-dependent protein